MFELEIYSYIKKIYPFEWVMLGIYMIIILLITFFIQVKNINKNPLYKYYTWAVLAKISAAVGFCLIYIYYYNGGDTVSYYETSRALLNMGLKSPENFMRVISEPPSSLNYSLFDSTTGYPWGYMYFDSSTWFVAKLLVPVLFVAFKSYLVSTVILSWLSFLGIWRLFLMVCRYYPGLEKQLAICFLFLPSVLFWGSGILKDTFTFSAVAWFIVALDGVFISKKKIIRNLLVLLLAGYLLMVVKPYILISLLPGAVVWILYTRIAKMNSRALKYFAIPLIYLMSFVIGFGVLSLLGDRLGKFSVNKMLQTAIVTQKDLHQDYYNGSSFDIGEFEPTLGGVLSKAPIAMRVGLFQPFIWEARNVVMIASGIENAVFLYLALYAVFRMFKNMRKFFTIFVDNPFLIFLVSYSLLFSVLVGLSTSNFGALVRFKIPFMPSFVCAMLVLNYFLRRPRSVQYSNSYTQSLVK